MSDLVFTPSQTDTIERCVNVPGNYFITECGSTGKSAVLREVIRRLRNKWADTVKVAVTATTGAAACAISGTTLHTFGGIRLGADFV